MRNLARITNFGNKQSALWQWEGICKYAKEHGQEALVVKCQYPENAGWRKIDKASSKLFAALKAVEQIRAADSPLACPDCGTLEPSEHTKYCTLNITASR